MTSFAYPKRESSGKQSAVQYYYCAESITGQNGERVRYKHGTILDAAKKEVIMEPKFYVTYNNLTGEGIQKYCISDCTVVNFYYINGSWKMGTKNSWDVSDIQEFQNETNQMLFDQVIEKRGYTIDFNSLDKKRIHTFAFSNPRCHFLASEYAIWSYDPTHEFVDSPKESTEDTGYVMVNQATGELGIKQSQIWKDITTCMYTNRISVVNQESRWEIAVVKILLRVFFARKSCHTYDKICEFFDQNLNPECKKIFEVIKSAIAEADNHLLRGIKEYKGFRIPEEYLESLSGFQTILNNDCRGNKTFLLNLIIAKLEEL